MEVIEHHRQRDRRSPDIAPAGWWERSLRHPLTAWAILGLSLVITAAAWWLTRHYAIVEAQQRFERRTDDIQARIQARMDAYAQMLRGGAALLAGTGEVSRREWKRYYDTLQPEATHPGLQGLGLARWLRADERAEHEAAVRAEGFADYAVRPEGTRDAYTAIVYLEPFAGRNLRAFGYDMFSEPVRREAMQRARDTGETAMSGIVTLVQEDGRNVQKGFLVYQPLYHDGTRLLAGQGAPAALWGWVYAPFRVNDLMEGILGRDLGNIAFRIHDGVPVDPAEAFYDSRSIAPLPSRAMEFERQLPLDFGGRRWAIVYQGADFVSAAGALSSTTVAALGIAVDLLLFVTIAMLARRKNLFEAQMRENGAQSQARQAWLEGVSGLSPDAVLVFERSEDGTARLVFTNPAFSRLFGLRPEDLLGLSESAVDEWLQGLRREGQSAPALCPSEGTLAVAGPPLRILQRHMREDTQRRVYYFRDVTRETEVERLKNEFLTTAAHELRTPLASVYGFAELMQRDDLSEETRQRANAVIYRQAALLKHLVDELLDLARLDARAGQDLVRARNDLRVLAAEAAESFLRPEHPSRIALHMAAEPLWIDADAAKLRQAVTNVLSNAVKYSPSGAAISLVVQKSWRNGVPMAVVRVADRGIGMTPDQSARAFERFYRADPSGHVPGAGLGLSLVQEIVRLHAGSVELESAVSVGTQVMIWLPLRPAEPAPAVAATEAAEALPA